MQIKEITKEERGEVNFTTIVGKYIKLYNHFDKVGSLNMSLKAKHALLLTKVFSTYFPRKYDYIYKKETLINVYKVWHVIAKTRNDANICQ